MDEVKELIVGSFKVVSTELGNCQTSVSIPSGEICQSVLVISSVLHVMNCHRMSSLWGFEDLREE
jgi:hypothetical protein